MATSFRSLVRRLWLALNPSPAAELDRTARRVIQLDRRQRYGILESFAKQTAYHGSYADEIKRDFGAYRHVRPIFGRCKRILDVHRALTMGGLLDPDAGPGKDVPSCLPILAGKDADQQAISRAVASLWGASNWQAKKSVYTGTGATCGDVGLEVIADERKGVVRLRVIHPSEIADDPVLDAYGNVRSIVLEREEIDPEDRTRKATVIHKREFINEDGVVTVRSFRGDSPYAWPDTPGSEWRMPWGFVPIVLAKHIDDGSDWGEAEHNAALFKTVARDSAGSALDDQVLKAIKGMWFLSGATIGKEKVKLEDLTENRDDLLILTCNSKDGSIQALVFPVPIAEASAHGQSIDKCIEDDYPELRINPVGLDASGESRKEARREVESKIQERRASYDAVLARGHQMAMTIGGILGMDDYSSFSADSFRAGRLDHRIGPRPVFGVDPLDVLKVRQAEADAVKTLVDAGWPVEIATERVMGEADAERLKEVLAEVDQQEQRLQDDLPGLKVAQ